MKGRCPGPLDDRDVVPTVGVEPTLLRTSVACLLPLDYVGMVLIRGIEPLAS